jgi:8-oxo-dGTP diphosphatase
MAETVVGASYVVGFMFNPAENSVLLLRKNRPSWQEGKLNGIGGKVEDGENPIQSMRRECIEEVGIVVDSWSQFCVLSDERGWRIHFFSTVGPILNASPMTDEKPEVVSAFALPFDVIPNLKWLIPMALSMRFERIDYFDIREIASRI